MSYYPLFLDLRGRGVLMIGAGSIAERKAAPLIRAGARINVVARDLSPQFCQWLVEGRVNHLGLEFSPNHIDTHYLVIAATDDHGLNARVFAACEEHNTLCNAVDDPAHCSAVTAATVDRGDLQIAISSGGKSPVLARYWQAHIDRLVPQSAAKLAAFAGKLRARIKNAVPDAAARRHYWERLIRSPVGETLARGDETEAERIAAALLEGRSRGEVALVGAGPGDPGLLTLHALQALHAADIVFYDALVSPEILHKIRKDADKVCVGKRAAKDGNTPQSRTNELLIQAARQGLRVVRLKGGDPFVFGRGGEECEALRAAGIPYRVIPGISAANGVAAYAGIPLTHREHAQSVMLLTGQCRPDGSDVDWQTLALARQTLVIYMGAMRSETISQALIRHGRDPQTPVAVISDGTLPTQQSAQGTLAELAQLAAQAPLPALIIIGEVAGLAEKLAWYQAQNAHDGAP